MAERNPPAWLQSGSHPADLDRQLLETLIPTAGVVDLDGGHLAVTEQSTPAMGVTVAAGSVAIAGTEAAAQGVYHAVNDAAADLAVSASDPTNPRVDLVIARVRDAFYSGATNAWALEIVTGTPAATPSEPAVPDNAHVLARIDVPASAASITNANLTDRRTQAGFRAAGLRQVVTFTTSGTFTKADYPWLRKVRVRLVGAGGAGGGAPLTGAGQASAGGGGGAGGYAEKLLDVADLAASETVTVGAGGVGASGANGGNGSASSFGAHCAADGGDGAGFAAASSTLPQGTLVGDGGIGTTGDVLAAGGQGQRGIALRVSGANAALGGPGGDSVLGGGGIGERANNSPAPGAGRQYGGGGGGGARIENSSAATGGDGADGVVIVELYG